MARGVKYIKVLAHLLYLLFVSYLITQRTTNTGTILKLDRYIQDMKHILLWTKIHGLLDNGQQYFIEKKCGCINCFFTSNRSLFSDTRYFDVILFNLQEVSKSANDLPLIRSENQRFYFAANDSADNYPVCDSAYDNGFFNGTWTYRTDSAVVYRHFTVYNKELKLMEERKHLIWLPYMDPLDSFQQQQLMSKSKAAAIFLDKCESRSQREIFITKLKEELTKYNLTVDVYGKCGTLQCKKKTWSPCYWRIRKDYFFYLALEDSLAPDYITDGVLIAYKNNAVPIVYGGADYRKFLPPGSYINAMMLSEEALAKKMYTIMRQPELYHNFFRWQNHYDINEARVLDGCHLCDRLNQPYYLEHKSSYKKFREWWNPWYKSRCSEDSFMYFKFL